MTLLDTAILFVSGLSAVLDYSSRRIPNWLILFGLVCGVTLNALRGGDLLLQSLIGFVVGIVFLIPAFACGWIGAGDVKYFGVVGSLLGVFLLPRVFFYSSLAAGLIAVSYLALGTTRFALFRQSWMELKVAFLTMGHVLPQPMHKRSQQNGSVPWGVAFAAGTIIAYFFDPSGRWAGF